MPVVQPSVAQKQPKQNKKQTYSVNVVVKERASPLREFAVLASGVATMFSAPALNMIMQQQFAASVKN